MWQNEYNLKITLDAEIHLLLNWQWKSERYITESDIEDIFTEHNNSKGNNLLASTYKTQRNSQELGQNS